MNIVLSHVLTLAYRRNRDTIRLEIDQIMPYAYSVSPRYCSNMGIYSSRALPCYGSARLLFPLSQIRRFTPPVFDTSAALSRRAQRNLLQLRRFQPAVLLVPTDRVAESHVHRSKLNPQFALALLVIEPCALALL